MDAKRLNQIASRIASLPMGKLRTAGKIEFVKDTGPIRRDIRVQNFNWTPDSLRELSKILWASQRAHSYAMAAFRLFSKIPSSQISPDGLLGGRGYIQNIKDMRTSLAQAAEVLSSFTDTVDDEINAPHWQTPDGTAEQIQDQAEEVKENPAGFVQEEFQEENPEETFDEPVENPDAEELNPQLESDTTDNGDNDGWGDEGPDEDNGGQTQMAAQLASYADTAPNRIGSGAPIALVNSETRSNRWSGAIPTKKAISSGLFFVSASDTTWMAASQSIFSVVFEPRCLR